MAVNENKVKMVWSCFLAVKYNSSMAYDFFKGCMEMAVNFAITQVYEPWFLLICEFLVHIVSGFND